MIICIVQRMHFKNDTEKNAAASFKKNEWWLRVMISRLHPRFTRASPQNHFRWGRNRQQPKSNPARNKESAITTRVAPRDSHLLKSPQPITGISSTADGGQSDPIRSENHAIIVANNLRIFRKVPDLVNVEIFDKVHGVGGS